LRGIVRAQGWAEAEKAKAQRKPAAMREHEQIFGQAPSGGESAHDLIPLVGREAWGDSIVASKSEGSELVEIEKR